MQQNNDKAIVIFERSELFLYGMSLDQAIVRLLRIQAEESLIRELNELRNKFSDELYKTKGQNSHE